MRATRRDVLGGIACGLGAGTLPLLPSRRAAAQTGADPVTLKLRTDLVQHAAFGDKFSGSPGDLATAEWVARRSRSSRAKPSTPRCAVALRSSSRRLRVMRRCSRIAASARPWPKLRVKAPWPSSSSPRARAAKPLR